MLQHDGANRTKKATDAIECYHIAWQRTEKTVYTTQVVTDHVNKK